jgi:dolichol kinase
MSEVTKEQVQEFEELVEKTSGLQIWRRVFHVACGLLVAGLVTFGGAPSRWMTVGLGAAFVVSLGMDLIRLYLPGANRLFYRLFPSLLTPRDSDRLASSTYYVLGLFLTFLIFPERVAVAATIVLAVADPAGNLVGRTVGSRPFGTGTVEGTLGLVLASFAAIVGLVGVIPAAVASVCTGIVETRNFGLDDNLTVPLAAGASLWAVGLIV